MDGMHDRQPHCTHAKLGTVQFPTVTPAMASAVWLNASAASVRWNLIGKSNGGGGGQQK